MQIPPDRAGVVHIWYETCEGIDIEELRSDKNMEHISAYDASKTTVLGAFLHAVNYYPLEDNYTQVTLRCRVVVFEHLTPTAV